MKHTELEDGDQLVIRTELREVLLAIHSDLREMIRNKWWVPILVALIAMAANTLIAILFRHH